MATFGELSWDSELGGGSQKPKSNWADTFLKLTKGNNEMRVVTQPYQYLVHTYKKDESNAKDFGQKILCSNTPDCPLCQMGNKPKKRYYLGVISRALQAKPETASNPFRLLDAGYSIVSGIKTLVENKKHYGDPSKYDIDIVVDPSKGATGYYTVVGTPKEPLSAEDQAIRDAIDLDDIKRRTVPLSVEKVKERMAKVNGTGEVVNANVPKSAAKPAAKKATAPSIEDDDSESDFPPFEA